MVILCRVTLSESCWKLPSECSFLTSFPIGKWVRLPISADYVGPRVDGHFFSVSKSLEINDCQRQKHPVRDSQMNCKKDVQSVMCRHDDKNYLDCIQLPFLLVMEVLGSEGI